MSFIMGFTISTTSNCGLTLISNSFIQNHMPSANGNFVKIYLYLVMLCQHADTAGNSSIDALADCFECTESDILRALRYWQKEGLLSFTEQNGEITSIVLSTDATDTASAVTAEREPDIDASPVAEETVVPDGISIPNRQEYTPLQAEALMKDIEISEAISQAEKILGTTLSTTHLQMILYFMCDIGFSQEMIATLYRTAHSRGKTSPKYMEAIGLTWAKKGITTPEEAKDESSAFSGLYHVVSKALGLNRSLAPAEREIIDTWSDYGFSDEIIEQACKRTVLQTGGTNLNYITRCPHPCGHRKMRQVISAEEKNRRAEKLCHTAKKEPIPEFSSKRVFQRGLQFTGKTVTAQCAGIKQTKGSIYYAFDQQSVRASDVPLLSSAAQGQFHPEKAHEGSL